MAGSGVGVGVSVGTGIAVGVSVGAGVAVGVLVGTGVGVSVGAVVGVSVGAGAMVGSAACPPQAATMTTNNRSDSSSNTLPAVPWYLISEPLTLCLFLFCLLIR